MISLSELDIQAIKDEAWKSGFEAGAKLRESQTSETAIHTLLEQLSDLLDTEKGNDDEIEVEVEIGDIVELQEDEYYIVCKVDRDQIAAVDPKHHRLVSGKKSDIISIGKIDLTQSSTDDESL